MTTAVQDRAFPASADDGLTELKGFLDIPAAETGDDLILGLALAAAKDAADQYLNNPFTTTVDGVETEDPIPPMVELGVLVWAATEGERLKPGVVRRKAGGLEEQYSSAEETIRALERRYWSAHRVNPGM